MQERNELIHKTPAGYRLEVEPNVCSCYPSFATRLTVMGDVNMTVMGNHFGLISTTEHFRSNSVGFFSADSAIPRLKSRQ